MKKRFTPLLRIAGLACLLLAVLLPTAFATQNRIQASPDLSQKVTLDRSLSPALAKSVDTGRLNGSQNLGRMVITLAPSTAQDAAATAYIRALHDRSSGQFHKWLTPAQFGEQFGISSSDAAQVKSWLENQGLTVHEVSQSRRFITFSGNVSQVEHAFSTQIHSYMRNGRNLIANSTSIQVPAALKPVIKSVGLAGYAKHSSNPNLKIVKQQPFDPASGVTGLASFVDGTHALAPADFATIYDITPVYGNNIDGTGQTIAIVGRMNIDPNDVATFRSFFGLPDNAPNVIVNGDDPGIGDPDPSTIVLDVLEAMLDIEWSGAVAPGAKINYVVSESEFDDGVAVSATYIVDHALSPVMSTSYGQCEANAGLTDPIFWNSLWEQAAAEGITALVSSGDNGGAGCYDPGAGTLAAQNGFGVSELASTPFNVAVGGTQFSDTDSSTLYWGLFNDKDTKQSVLSYIPEVPWNESSNDPNNVSLWAGSGGASQLWSKPDWQVGLNVPQDGRRDLPDVSLTAASHDGYLVWYKGSLFAVGGTSASSPSFAGIMALINQATGAAQGQANYVLYPLANGPNGSSIFHDVQTGNNMVPDASGAFDIGFNAGPGYDMATGLGSVDVAQLIQHWSDISLADAAESLALQCPQNQTCDTITHGTSLQFSTTVSSAGGSGPTPTGSTVMVAVAQQAVPTATVRHSKSGNSCQVIASDIAPQPLGSTVVTGGPATLANGQATNNFANLPGGTWSVSSQYSGDGAYLGTTSAAVTITVTPENSQIYIGPVTDGNPVTTPVQFFYGEPVPMGVYVGGPSGVGYPSGQVNIQSNGNTVATPTLQYGEQSTVISNQPVQGSSTIVNLTGLAAGTYSLQAIYPGDASFTGSSSNVYSLVVSKAPTYVSEFGQTGTAVPNTPITLSGVVSLCSGVPCASTGMMDGQLNFVDVTNPASPVVLNATPITVGPDGSFSGSVQFSSIGNYTVQAQFLGSANLNASTHLLSIVVAGSAATTTTLSTTSQSIAAGATASYKAVVTSSVSQKVPSGSVSFSDGTTSLGSASLDGTGTATLTTNALVTSGVHTVTASYGGDNLFAPSSSAASVTTSVTASGSVTSLSTNAASVVTGTAVTFTAAVTTTSTNTLPVATGTITFYDGSTSLGTGTLDATGKATYSTSALSIGSHAITASYGGDQTFAASASSAIAESVTAVASTTALTTSAASVATGASVTFTAAVTSSSKAIPTGTVTFYDGSTSLGTGTLDATGKATYSTSALSIGSHAITASYGGDQTFAASTSTSLAELVTGAPDYSVQIAPSTITITAGQSGQVVFNILPINGYNQSITFSCNALPASATCSFSPATITPDGTNKPSPATLTISTSGAASASIRTNRWMAVSAIAFGGVLFALPFNARKRRWGLTMFLTIVALIAFAVGCGSSSGSGSNNTPPPNSNYTKPGTYSVTVQAQAGTAAAKTASLTINVVQ